MTLAKLIDFLGGGKNNLLKVAIASSVFTIITPVQVQAASVTILNPSFESPTAPLQPGGQFFSIDQIADWTVTGRPYPACVFNPSASTINTGIQYFNQSVPDGVQTACSNGGTIFQPLLATLQSNTKYTLSVFVGRRNDSNFPGYNVELLVGSTVLASNNSVIPDIGTFAPVNVKYISDPSNLLLGQPLGIRLSSIGVQTGFDNVTLDATAVPEPLTILGVGTALGFGATFKRKLTKKQNQSKDS